MRHPLSLWENSQTLTSIARNCGLLRCCLIFSPYSCGHPSKPVSIRISRQEILLSHTKLLSSSIRAPQELFCLLSISDSGRAAGTARRWDGCCVGVAAHGVTGDTHTFLSEPALCRGASCSCILPSKAFSSQMHQILVLFCISYEGDVQPPLCKSGGYMSPLSGM